MNGSYSALAWRAALDCLQCMLWLSVLAASAAAQTPLTPQRGVLVLRHGQVLAGEILPAGDYFVVTQGSDVELRVRAEQVECFCGSLVEAYEFKLRHLTGSGALPHLKLAEWCLRQDLLPQCAAQLVAAMRLEPDHPYLRDLEQRLALRAEAPADVPPPPQGSPSVLGPAALEEALRDVPPAAIERFGTVVQPILLNRCAAGQCHGPSARSSLRLLRPPAGQTITRRFTQRNLATVLSYVDPHDPLASPLLVKPQTPHGGSVTAVFDRHSQAQLAELVAWVKLRAPPAPASPASHAPAPPALSVGAAPGGTTPATTGPSPPAAMLSQPSQHAAAPAGPSPVAAATPSAAAPRGEMPGEAVREAGSRPPAAVHAWTPRDRYDPELFNRRFHPSPPVR
jgi:hypothetical protein